MNVLLDACVPRLVRKCLNKHTVRTAQEMNWGELKNGALLKVAETQFDCFVTTDKNLKYQQNLTGRRLAILVIPTNDWKVLKEHPSEIGNAVDKLKPRDFVELTF